jgi:hypothetical protein
VAASDVQSPRANAIVVTSSALTFTFRSVDRHSPADNKRDFNLFLIGCPML